MKKFLKNIAILLLIISLCCSVFSIFGFTVVGSQYKYNYQASIIDKVNRLESINEPKIILVGNSNLAFGIDSEMIEEATGMPVVNLGLHGGLGNAFHEQIAKYNINKGDLVIVCHSSFSDTDNIGDASLAWITIDNNIKFMKLLRIKDYPTMMKAYPNYFKKTLFFWVKHNGNWETDGCYSRSAFNKYGDIMVKPISEQIDPDEFFSQPDNLVPDYKVSKKCVKRLNQYNEYIKSKGATLLVAGYPIAYGKYSPFTKDDFNNLNIELQNKLDCDVISDYTDYFYPYEYFYDSVFHLNREGTTVRTKQLIEDINNWKSQH